MKTKKLLALLLSIAMLVSVFCAIPVSATDFAPDETGGSVYTIDNVDEWKAFADACQTKNFEGKTVRLGADLDFKGKTITNAAGNWTIPFAGTFDGQEHTVSNFKIASTEASRALFTYVAGSATIKNLKIESSSIGGTKKVAALVGTFQKQDDDTTLYATAESLTISNVHVYSTAMTGTGYVGGLVGYVENATDTIKIENSSFNGKITSTGDSVGGAIGYHKGSATTTISGCSFHLTISASGQYVGGIFGAITNDNISVTVKDCIVTGTEEGVTGGASTGGLGGFLKAAETNIQNCVVDLNLNAGKNAGMLIGEIGSVATSFSASKVLLKGTITSTAVNSTVGCVVGWSKGTKGKTYAFTNILVAVTPTDNLRFILLGQNDNANTVTVSGYYDSTLLDLESTPLFQGSYTNPTITTTNFTGKTTEELKTTAVLDGWVTIPGDYPMPAIASKAPKIIGYQTTYDKDITEGQKATYSIRVVAVLYGTDCTAAGFKDLTITSTADSATTKTVNSYNCQYVYRTIQGGGETYKALENGGVYLFTVEITDVPSSITDFELTATPFAVNGEGQTLTGEVAKKK